MNITDLTLLAAVQKFPALDSSFLSEMASAIIGDPTQPPPVVRVRLQGLVADGYVRFRRDSRTSTRKTCTILTQEGEEVLCNGRIELDRIAAYIGSTVCPSLLDELSAEDLNEERVEQLLREAREGLEARRRTREEKLRGLGYEDPSDEQRRQQLALTVALLDWPKK